MALKKLKNASLILTRCSKHQQYKITLIRTKNISLRISMLRWVCKIGATYLFRIIKDSWLCKPSSWNQVKIQKLKWKRSKLINVNRMNSQNISKRSNLKLPKNLIVWMVYKIWVSRGILLNIDMKKWSIFLYQSKDVREKTVLQMRSGYSSFRVQNSFC